jgi:hypothetical protein
MKVAKRAFEGAIEHLHPTRNVRDMIDQLTPPITLQVLIAFTQNVVQMKMAERAFECTLDNLHPTKVLEQRANHDLRQGRQPIGVCRF